MHPLIEHFTIDEDPGNPCRKLMRFIDGSVRVATEAEQMLFVLVSDRYWDTQQEEVDERINVNTASAEELCTIKGVGLRTAEQIIASRDIKPFDTVENFIERFRIRIQDPSMTASLIKV